MNRVITLSIGNASTVCPLKPVVLVAVNRELMMASSVASIAAIKAATSLRFVTNSPAVMVVCNCAEYASESAVESDHIITTAIGGNAARFALSPIKARLASLLQITCIQRGVGRYHDHAGAIYVIQQLIAERKFTSTLLLRARHLFAIPHQNCFAPAHPPYNLPGWQARYVRMFQCRL